MRCFEKVSLDEFKKYYDESLYDFNLPSRSTKRSAGYDFFAPSDFIIKKGDSFAQGIFLKYLLTDDDDEMSTRSGGIGSTDRRDSNE